MTIAAPLPCAGVGSARHSRARPPSSMKALRGLAAYATTHGVMRAGFDGAIS
jgi:hypothetical protein